MIFPCEVHDILDKSLVTGGIIIVVAVVIKVILTLSNASFRYGFQVTRFIDEQHSLKGETAAPKSSDQ